MAETYRSSDLAGQYSSPPLQPTVPSKLALLRGGPSGGDMAMTQGSSSSLLHLLVSPTQMSSGTPFAHDSRSATQTYQESISSRDDDIARHSAMQPQQYHNTNNEPTGPVGGGANPRRSISARTLAQELAPHLSEQDIIRLADNIVARMQLTGAAMTPDQQSRIVAGENESDLVVDPPPPWRASWNGGAVGSSSGTAA
jgi:hypothetical protein